MKKEERFIDYDDEEGLDAGAGQCCLRAGHLALGFSVLALLAGAALVASHYDEHFLAVRTPAGAIFGLAVFLAAVTAVVSVFVECRLQERWAVCRGFYLIVCSCCMDDIDRRLLQNAGKAPGVYDNVGHSGTRSNSPDKKATNYVLASGADRAKLNAGSVYAV